MLGFVSGKIISKNADTSQVIVQAHRVGYELTVPKHVYDSLVLHQKAALWVHTHVREDALTLYGFLEESEKHLFRVLISASGVGPKVGMALLTQHGPARLVDYILKKATDEIAEAPGVGKKLAQKLVLELGSKAEKFAWLDMGTTAVRTVERQAPESEETAKNRLYLELSSALQNLAFPPSQVKSALDRLFEREDMDELGFERGFKIALQELSGRAYKVEEVSPRA